MDDIFNPSGANVGEEIRQMYKMEKDKRKKRKVDVEARGKQKRVRKYQAKKMNFIGACGLIMIFLIYENLVGSNSILEKTSSRLRKTKTKYMMCKFRKIKKNLRKFLR